MIHRITLAWPASRDPWPRPRQGALRVLAVSDDRDPGLERAEGRAALGRIDLVVGCGDLEPDYLALLADAFMAPLVYVRGNHDRGQGWHEHAHLIPEPMPDARPVRRAELRLAGLSWPGDPTGRAQKDGRAAWRQALALALRASRGDDPSLVLVSHVPPEGLGDSPDTYHRGFAAYRWLVSRLRPRLWLHGHTHPAASRGTVQSVGHTTIIDVTAATLIELMPA